MTIKDYSELRVYQSAYESAMVIYRLTRFWPTEERYSLTSQILKSSRSVCANIAEGWRKRRYEAAFIAKLSDADAEAAEVQTWLRFACDCGHLDTAKKDQLLTTYHSINAQLCHMMDHPEQWVLK